MTPQQQQIVIAYEEINLGVEDIAREHDLDSMVVKACLMQYSLVYREALKAETGSVDKQLDFTDDELELANKAISNLMQSTEDENMIFRCARYIRQDKKGRLDKAKGLQALNMGVGVFNEQLKKMEAAIDRAKVVKGSDKTINGSPNPAPLNMVVHQIEDAK